ncbi:hypothetical protein SAMN05216327_105334 [Dyadobacter sp. SG02]|uniref:hypothetical protein n=1 Tax=Dyadobacter sp. SG02 TaxID=1855291 RepID=UPI0008D3388D|nr:hypothetical protein [Dyadobacter sp. SG02]SEJ02446.1 hypothetical protein SAMN05216327_105334 [Dyadobacter sp. SG02]
MSKNYLFSFLLSLLFLGPAYGQIRFEKGYFIDNEGKRTECYIRDSDWVSNPTSFKYKLISKEEFGEASVDDVREFGTENGPVYIRERVNVDQSPVILNLLSSQRAPDWVEKLIFLKTLVAGPATLYVYRWSGITRFYYQVNGGRITPLVYKRYLDNDGNIASNLGFRQELLNGLQCKDIPGNWVARLNYTETDMERCFNRYNRCVDPGVQISKKDVSRETFNLRLTPGAELAMMKAERYTRFADGDSKRNSFSGRLGLEAEYILPFNKNKWGLLAEPTLQNYKTPLDLLGLKLNADHWAVELPVGVRHYFFLSNNTRLFVNGLAVFHLASWQSSASRRERDMEMRSRTGLALGVGISKGRWGAEIRYGLPRSVFASYVNIDVKRTKASLVLGYKLFSR